LQDNVPIKPTYTMKRVLQIVLYVLAGVLVFMIYRSINNPIKFKKIRQERYTAVIAKLKDIRDAEEAHRIVTGKYTGSFEELIKFIETARFTITQQRDSSYVEFNKTYQIDMLKEVKIIDTLGFKSVKDSLFGTSDRYKTLMYVPYAPNKEKFQLQAGFIDKSGYKAPVFEAKVAKDIILYDQPADLVAQEKELISVDEVNGPEIIVGSLTDVSTNGNWPTIYDAKKHN
jgi:hypothetical protein